MSFNYQKICQTLLNELPDRTKEVLSRRFGLQANQRETLDSIGASFGICRERVRQIERDGLAKLRTKINQHKQALQYLEKSLKNIGGIRRENYFIESAGSPNSHNHIFFLLSLGKQFTRYNETPDFYSLWSLNKDYYNCACKIARDFVKKFENKRILLSPKEIFLTYQKQVKPQKKNRSLNLNTLINYLEVSKKIKQCPKGNFGLKKWPEVSPKGVKDKAYLVLIGQGQPLHFSAITSFINKAGNSTEKQALVRTVHNELIKDPRFVLVGRGLYALKEWGYQQGPVRDVILQTLKIAHRPLTKQEVLDKVLKQRFVKPSTILLNLNNSRELAKDEQGRYYVTL